MSNSTHVVEVFRLEKIEKHPNADTLDCVDAFGYPVIVKSGQFVAGDLVCFIPPDNCVPLDREEFSWLKRSRVTACKLRGIPSFGLLLKAPDGFQEGDNVAEHFGITHYEPPAVSSESGNVRAPRRLKNEVECPTIAPVYDLEAIRKYKRLFEGRQVHVTEKLHGCNGRFTYSSADQTFYCGSREWWKQESDTSVWWKAFKKNTELQQFLRANPDVVAYGEVAGQVQGGFSYGDKGPRIFVFDIMRDGQFLNPLEARELTDPYSVQWVPTVASDILFDMSVLEPMAEGKSLVDNKTQREGIVISPMVEESDPRHGRLKMKLVGMGYLSKSVDEPVPTDVVFNSVTPPLFMKA